jgi:hypothetical protein
MYIFAKCRHLIVAAVYVTAVVVLTVASVNIDKFG